jgi:hypothetical protein
LTPVLVLEADRSDGRVLERVEARVVGHSDIFAVEVEEQSKATRTPMASRADPAS